MKCPSELQSFLSRHFSWLKLSIAEIWLTMGVFVACSLYSIYTIELTTQIKFPEMTLGQHLI